MTNTFILSISKALLAGWLLSSSYVHPMRIDDKESLRGTVFRVSAFEVIYTYALYCFITKIIA